MKYHNDEFQETISEEKYRELEQRYIFADSGYREERLFQSYFEGFKKVEDSDISRRNGEK